MSRSTRTRSLSTAFALCILASLAACDSGSPPQEAAPQTPQLTTADELTEAEDGEEELSVSGEGIPSSVSVTHTVILENAAPTEVAAVTDPAPEEEEREAPSADDNRSGDSAGSDLATVINGAGGMQGQAFGQAAVGGVSRSSSGIAGGSTGSAGLGRSGGTRLNLGGNLADGGSTRPTRAMVAPMEPVGSREQFEDYGENDWTLATEDPLATFSIDVDTASYAIARRDLNSARLPNPDGVRVEEFINVFDYGYAAPENTETPFAVHLEAAPSHFGDGLQLLRVGIQGFETDIADRAPANLVFLIDTSGSMRGANKMGLVQYALGTLLNSLGPDDTLSIVTYSGRADTLLAPTHVDDRAAIRDAIDALTAGGSTNGADGIRTAYEVAQSAFLEGGTNRVIWCTDGDLNVGMTGDQLLEFVEDHGRRGVALTTLGFGRGNLNDRDLERFADRGDGNYHYIDDQNEALRVLSDELMGTLEIIARDVKIQVEVNPHIVESYRIIGYENRDVADADFRNDSVDAGEIGSGHNVTALLELDLDDSAVITRTETLATVRVRYEMPDEEGEGREIEQTIHTDQIGDRFEDASASLRLAAAVAEFAEVLRRGENATGAEFDEVERVVRGAHARGDLQVEELAALVTQARSLWQR